MKAARLLVIAALAVALLIAMTVPALAEGYNSPNTHTRDNGYFSGPHGGYTTTTNKCQDCHSTHYAAGSFVLTRANSREAACDYCHAGGAGSAINIQMDNEYGAESAVTTTTMGFGTGHTLGYKGNAPADIDPAFSSSQGLACFDCHTPHGNSARVIATFGSPGTIAGEGDVDGPVYRASLLDTIMYDNYGVPFSPTVFDAAYTGNIDALDISADFPGGMPSAFYTAPLDQGGQGYGPGITSVMYEWMFWSTDFDGNGFPNAFDGDAGNGTISNGLGAASDQAFFGNLTGAAFSDYYVYWAEDVDMGNIVTVFYNFGDASEGLMPRKEIWKKPLFPKGRYLLLKNPDSSDATDTVVGDDDGNGVIDNGENKIPTDWDKPLGPAATWGPISITDQNWAFPLKFPWAADGVAMENEVCTDCHDGAAGASTQQASVWKPNPSDSTTGAFISAYSHDSNPMGCARQQVLNPGGGTNPDGTANTDGTDDNFGPHCRNCHTGAASCQQCHGDDADHDYDLMARENWETYNGSQFTASGSDVASEGVTTYDPPAYAKTYAVDATGINGQCIDGGFSYPHRTLGANMLKDSLYGVDFDGSVVGFGDSRVAVGNTTATVAAYFGETADDYFGRTDLRYPNTWRAEELVGQPVDNLDSVCIDCHGDGSYWDPTATFNKTYYFGPNGPMDTHSVQGWELLLKGLP